MRFLFFIFVITFFANAVSASKIEVIDVNKVLVKDSCSKLIKEQLEEWGASREKWRGRVGEDEKLIYFKPTNMFAVWIEYQEVEGRKQFSKISPSNILNVRFDNKCNKSFAIINDVKKDSIAENVVDDEKLFSFIHKNVTGLIYSWSPHMSLSLEGLKSIQEVSKELKLPLIVLLDPFAKESLAKKRLKESHIELDKVLVSGSLELHFRNAYIHYPNLLLFKDGKMLNDFLPGLSSKEQYKRYIKSRILR